MIGKVRRWKGDLGMEGGRRVGRGRRGNKDQDVTGVYQVLKRKVIVRYHKHANN